MIVDLLLCTQNDVLSSLKFIGKCTSLQDRLRMLLIGVIVQLEMEDDDAIEVFQQQTGGSVP